MNNMKYNASSNIARSSIGNAPATYTSETLKQGTIAGNDSATNYVKVEPYVTNANCALGDPYADVKPRPIGRVGIIGTSPTAVEIAMNFLDADMPVTMFDSRLEPLNIAAAQVRLGYRNSVVAGELTEHMCARRIGFFAGTLSLHHLKDCDLIIETGSSDKHVQETLFRKLDQIAKSTAILAADAQTSDINFIARLTRRPGDVVGLRLASPESVFKVIPGKETAADVIVTAIMLLEKLRN